MAHMIWFILYGQYDQTYVIFFIKSLSVMLPDEFCTHLSVNRIIQIQSWWWDTILCFDWILYTDSLFRLLLCLTVLVNFGWHCGHFMNQALAHSAFDWSHLEQWGAPVLESMIVSQPSACDAHHITCFASTYLMWSIALLTWTAIAYSRSFWGQIKLQSDTFRDSY